jgi:hypothetical protein
MKLTEIYKIVKKRIIREANLDVDKFTRKAPGEKGHQPADAGRAAQGQDLGDIARAAGHQPEKKTEHVKFYELMPAPKEGIGLMSKDTAKKLKLV